MEFETPVNPYPAFSRDQLLPSSGIEMPDHLRALCEEVRYRIGEVRRAFERLEEAERRLVAALQHTEEPPF